MTRSVVDVSIGGRAAAAVRIAWTTSLGGLLLCAFSCGSEKSASPGGPRADLVVTRMATDPVAPDSNQAITVKVVIRNRGEVAAGESRTSVSVDGILTCAEIPIRGLAPGDSDSVYCDIGKRADAFHSIQACCDVTSAVAESSEDNCALLPLRVQPPPLPSDLFVRSLSFVPQSPVTSERVTIRITIGNQGAGPSPESRTDLFVEGVLACGSISTPVIESGDSAAVSCQISKSRAGDYSVRACADAPGLVQEEDEDNNCCWPSVLVVRDPETTPDLRIAELTFHPPLSIQGEADTVEVRIENAGNASSPASLAAVTVDGEPSCSAIPTPFLPAGGDTVLTCILPPQPSGQHTVQACADIRGLVLEGREDNNCLSATLDVEVGYRPPVLIAPPLPDTVTFAAAADSALLAKEEINRRVLAARETAAAGNFLAPLRAAQWIEGDGGCWLSLVHLGECDYSYTACRQGAAFGWTLILDGICAGSVERSWFGMRGTSDLNGLAGECRFFAPEDSSDARSSIDWTQSDAFSGEWRFHDGEPGLPPSGVLRWSSSAQDGTVTTWSGPETSRWDLTHASDGDTMTMVDVSGLDSLRQEITWREGGAHGSWTISQDGRTTEYSW